MTFKFVVWPCFLDGLSEEPGRCWAILPASPVIPLLVFGERRISVNPQTNRYAPSFFGQQTAAPIGVQGSGDGLPQGATHKQRTQAHQQVDDCAMQEVRIA